MLNDDAPKTRRLARPSIPKAGKCWTPPKSKLKRTISAAKAPKSAQNREIRPLQLARKSYTPPSPKRKRPRIEQKPKKKVHSPLNRLMALAPSPSTPLPPPFQAPNSIDELNDDSGFPSFGNIKKMYPWLKLANGLD